MSSINPDYYKDKIIETIDAIESQLTREEFEGHCKGCVIKYLSRAGRKNGNSKRQDYLKAQWYLNRILKGAESTESSLPNMDAMTILTRTHDKQ